MPKFRIVAGALAAVLGLTSVGASAQGYYDHYDRDHHYHAHHHYYHACEAARRRDANTGTIVGGIGGALVGNALGGGHLAGTLIGGGVGAVAGHEIASNQHHC